MTDVARPVEDHLSRGSGVSDTRPGAPPITHPLYPMIDTAGQITKASKVVAFIFVILLPFLAAVLAGWLVWEGRVTPADWAIFAVMYAVSALGVTVGYHRLFTHRGFETPRLVRWMLAIAGCTAAQGAPIIWASQHRKHHAFSDVEGDPHSPRYGRKPGPIGGVKAFWHAHFGHVFDQTGPIDPGRYVPDLEKERFLVWMEKYGAIFVVIGMLVPAAVGGLIAQSWEGALTGLLWGGFVRLFVVNHATGAVNSVCHVIGGQRFPTGDYSGNVMILMPLTFGESWHNNHHAFPTSPRHGLRWWEIDPAWMFIWTMEKLGLARNVVRISREKQDAKLASVKEGA